MKAWASPRQLANKRMQLTALMFAERRIVSRPSSRRS